MKWSERRISCASRSVLDQISLALYVDVRGFNGAEILVYRQQVHLRVDHKLDVRGRDDSENRCKHIHAAILPSTPGHSMRSKLVSAMLGHILTRI